MKPCNMNITEVVQNYHANPIFGLNDYEVSQHTQQFGKNIYKTSKPKLISQFLKGIQDPVVFSLLFTSIVTIFINPSKWYIASILFILAMINISLGMYRIFKTNRILNTFKQDKVKVYRNSQVTLIDVEDVVVGDILVLEKGDYVASDARVIKSHHLELDESIITNDDSLILKQTNAIKERTDDFSSMRNMVFAKTKVVTGKGVAIVVSVGSNNAIHQLTTENYFNQNTPLYHSFNYIFKIVSFTMMFISLFIFSFEIKFGFTFLDAFINALKSTVKIIPECLAIVVALTLAISFNKLSNRNTVTTSIK